jgi:flagellar motor switch protein FliN
MNSEQWKQAVQIQLPALEALLEKVLGTPHAVDLKGTAEGSNEEAGQQMQKAGHVIRFLEKNFQSEVFIGFSSGWADVFSEQFLDGFAQSEDADAEMLAELCTHLSETITGALAETGVEVKVANLNPIKGENLSFNQQKYLRAALEAVPEAEGADALNIWLAVSQPDPEEAALFQEKFSDDNPFIDDRYANIATRFARHIDLGGSQNKNGNYKSEVSMEGQTVEFEDFGKSDTVNNNREVRNIDILKDVEMQLSVELGRRKMPLGNILQLVKGSVIELEKLAGEPVEILVNGYKIAQGDVVVIDEHFGVRISNLLASQERIKELQ